MRAVRFVITGHAARRFQERIAPGLDVDDCVRRLKAMLELHGRRVELPPWLPPFDQPIDDPRRLHDVWFMVGDDLAAVCVPKNAAGTLMTVKTVTCRGLIGEDTRARRNHARSVASHRRRLKGSMDATGRVYTRRAGWDA